MSTATILHIAMGLIVVAAAAVFLLPAHDAHASTVINKAPASLGLISGLLGYWSFDGPDMAGNTAYDRSGQGNDGTLTNGPTRKIGRIGQALEFDGSGDYVNVGDPASGILDFGTNSFSYGMWFKNPRADDISINKKNGGSTIPGYDLQIGDGGTPGNVQARVGDNTADITSSVWSGTNDGNWHHAFVVVDRSGNALKLYGDGIQRGSDVSIASLGSVSNSTSLQIAARNGFDKFNGFADEVRIYNRALSPDEIRRLYKVGATLKINKATYTGTLTDGLVGYWSFDGPDIAGADPLFAYGRAGNNNHASSTGTTRPVRIRGRIGQGLEFDGTNDELNAARNSSLEVTTDFTMSVWFKRNTTNNGDSVFMYDNGFGSFCGAYTLTINDAGNNKLELELQNGTDDDQIVGASTIGTEWTHGAAVHTNGRTTLYINGAADIEGAQRDPVYNGGGQYQGFTIGAFNGGSCAAQTSQFPGTIDEVRIYNRALSPDEIKRLYKIGSTFTVNKSLNTGTLADGLVGWWTFDGLGPSQGYAPDESGNGNTGTLQNGPRRAIGKIGQALEFDNSADQYVSVDDDTALDGFDDFTISFWFNRDALDGQDEYMVAKYDVSANQRSWSVLFENTSNYLKLNLSTDGIAFTSVFPWSPFVPAAGIWYHVVATRVGNIVTGYIDGDKKGDDTFSGTLFAGAAPLTIAIRSDFNTSRDFDGRIDDVRIYNRALSPEEIGRLYRWGRTGR